MQKIIFSYSNRKIVKILKKDRALGWLGRLEFKEDNVPSSRREAELGDSLHETLVVLLWQLELSGELEFACEVVLVGTPVPASGVRVLVVAKYCIDVIEEYSLADREQGLAVGTEHGRVHV